MMPEDVRQILNPTDAISYLDIHFGRLMQRLAENDSPELLLAATLTSSQTRAGNICLDLTQLQDERFLQENLEDNLQHFRLPDSAKFESVLRGCSVVGSSGAFKPLIIDAFHCLYLNRYWDYQTRLADFIKRAAEKMSPGVNLTSLQESLQRYFPLSQKGLDWQKVAVAVANLKNFCVITGGPGTGKTFTVAKLLAVLLEQTKDLRVVLAAPTGKAAVRLQEAIKNAKKEMACPGEISALIPEEAATLHRVLGTIRHSPYFRHHEQHPLDVDVLVLDEASMVDLALVVKLVQALPENAKLILLGDNNQLASVEAGAVLADICDTDRPQAYSPQFVSKVENVLAPSPGLPVGDFSATGLHDCIVQLRKSYRFEAQKGIGALSRSVNGGDAEQAVKLLKDPEYPDIEWHDLASENPAERFKSYFENLTKATSVSQALASFEKLRILCAVRQGPQGANTINSQIDRYVGGPRSALSSPWYNNQPVLITQNDYTLGLYNGDLGLIGRDPESDDELRVHFRMADGSLRKLRPFRLPEHETAYALTVHKSQGSEFERVILLLPEQDTYILTRELVYTAITRATKKVEVWATEEVFCAAVSRRIARRSGLRAALWREEK